MRLLLAVFSLSLTLLTGCANLTEPGNSEPGGLSPVKHGSAKRDKVAKLDLPNDLWERIRKGYQMPDLEGPWPTTAPSGMPPRPTICSA